MPWEARILLKDIELYRYGCIITKTDGKETEFRRGSVSTFFPNHVVGMVSTDNHRTGIPYDQIERIEVLK